MTNPPYGHDPHSLPPGFGQPPDYPVSGLPGAYSPYGTPSQGQPPYIQPVSYGGDDAYGRPASRLPQPYSPYAAGYPAGYGYDPVTGQPLSDKSKVVAGLLQLLLGALLGLGGVGRLYAGNVSLGVIQIVVSVIGWISLCCGWVLFFVPYIVFVGAWIWFVVDGIVMLAGRPTDGQGRLLRS